MSLNDEERRTVVRLQMEKAHANFNQIPLLREAGYHGVSYSLLESRGWFYSVTMGTQSYYVCN